ncbi:hypothetical protein RJG79_04850 [Mycoplasmatota bacterium WC44]
MYIVKHEDGWLHYDGISTTYSKEKAKIFINHAISGFCYCPTIII